MSGSDRPCFGLVFDVDGVIADTESVNALVTSSVLLELFGIEDVVPSDFELGVGRGATEYVRAAARVHGVELKEGDVERATRRRQDRFLAHLDAHPLPAFTGVLELIAAADADPRFRVAIATSSTREKSTAVLRSASVPFERMVRLTGSDVTHKKPHPELFLRAAEELDLTASSCVVIEDAPNGVMAAKAAGAMCIAVTNSFPASELAEADRVVGSLDEVCVETLVELLAG